MRRSCWSLAALSACAVGGGTLQAIDPDQILNIMAGPARIQPRIGIAESYNDNIYYRPSEPIPGFITDAPVGDLVTMFTPGANVQFGREDGNNISLDYSMTGMVYALHPDETAEDHSFSLQGRYVGSKLTVSGSDRFDQLSSIYGGSSSLRSKVNRFTLSDAYSVSYQMTEKTGVYAQGQHNRIDFEKGLALYDSSTLRGTGGFNYQWTPKTGLFGEAYYGQAATTPNHPLLNKGPYSWFMGGFLGARGDFTARMSGTLRFGYEARGYGDGTSAPGGPVVDAMISHRFGDKTTASLEYSRRSQASIQFSRYSYVSDSVNLTLNQMVGNSGRLNASANASLQFDTYDPIAGSADRFDQRMTFSAALSYQIKLWMTAALSYEHERFASNSRSAIDYNVNRITVRLSIGY